MSDSNDDTSSFTSQESNENDSDYSPSSSEAEEWNDNISHKRQKLKI